MGCLALKSFASMSTKINEKISDNCIILTSGLFLLFEQMTSLLTCGQGELLAMVQLRKLNRAKAKNEDATFCICRRVLSGRMVQCQLCCELFHGNILSSINAVLSKQSIIFTSFFTCGLIYV